MTAGQLTLFGQREISHVLDGRADVVTQPDETLGRAWILVCPQSSLRAVQHRYGIRPTWIDRPARQWATAWRTRDAADAIRERYRLDALVMPADACGWDDRTTWAAGHGAPSTEAQATKR